MSDRPSDVQQTMDRIFLCNKIWRHCLPFLPRPTVGLEFALVSDRFDGLADAHLGSKKRPWTLGKLEISEGRHGNVRIFNWNTKKYVPSLPKEPMPDNAIGFECIEICYVNRKVIGFLRRIRRLLQQQPNNVEQGGVGLKLDISFQNARFWDVFRDSVWPLLNPSAITMLYVSGHAFDEFHQRFSPTFLFDLPNLRLVDVQFGVRHLVGPFGQLFREWLHTPRADANPKLLKNYADWDHESIAHFKTTFLNAQTCSSFIIAMVCRDDAVPFVLDNVRTGERLAFRKVQCVRNIGWLLERGPIGGRDGEKWAKWEREVMDECGQKPNLFDFWLPTRSD